MPKIPKKAWTVIVPALISVVSSVAGSLGYSFEFQKAGEADSPSNPQTEKVITQNTTEQKIDGENICPLQVSGSEGNSISCSTNNTENIEQQENIDRKIEAEQYNENNGSDPINCNRSNGTCGNNGTTTNIYSNPE